MGENKKVLWRNKCAIGFSTRRIGCGKDPNRSRKGKAETKNTKVKFPVQGNVKQKKIEKNPGYRGGHMSYSPGSRAISREMKGEHNNATNVAKACSIIRGGRYHKSPVGENELNLTAD